MQLCFSHRPGVFEDESGSSLVSDLVFAGGIGDDFYHFLNEAHIVRAQRLKDGREINRGLLQVSSLIDRTCCRSTCNRFSTWNRTTTMWNWAAMGVSLLS